MSADDAYIGQLLQAEQEGCLRLRVNVFAQYNLAWLDESGHSVYAGAWFPDHGPILDSARRLRIPGVRIFADGAGIAPRGCPAMTMTYSTSSYPCFQNNGDLYLSQTEMNEAVADLQAWVPGGVPFQGRPGHRHGAQRCRDHPGGCIQRSVPAPDRAQQLPAA